MTITQRPELAKLFATGKTPSEEFVAELEDYGHQFTKRTQALLAASGRQKLELNGLVPVAEHVLKDRNNGLPRTVIPGVAIADYADLAEHVLEDRK